MASTEIMSVEELRSRLLAIRAACPAHGSWLRKDAPVHLSVRLIAKHIGYVNTQLNRLANGGQPSETLQKRLSYFFRQWDRGLIVKERVNGKGVLLERDPQSHSEARASAASTASDQGTARSGSPEPRVIPLKVELTPTGVKLRV